LSAPDPLIPAKAGIQIIRLDYPKGGVGPIAPDPCSELVIWIPAFAGMSGE
jgi:hypothetical protein